MHKVFLLFLLFSLFSVTNAITISTLDEQFSQNKILGSIIEHSPHENSTEQAYDNFFENTFDWNLDFEINNTRVLNSGENLTSGLFSYNFRKVDFNFNSGSSLILNVPGEFYAGALKFQKDSKLIPQTNGSVIFYVGNDFQWNGTIVANARSCQTANKFLVRELCHYDEMRQWFLSLRDVLDFFAKPKCEPATRHKASRHDKLFFCLWRNLCKKHCGSQRHKSYLGNFSLSIIICVKNSILLMSL